MFYVTPLNFAECSGSVFVILCLILAEESSQISLSMTRLKCSDM